MNKITHIAELNLDSFFKELVLPANVMESEIMNKIILEIYNGWPGEVGKERVVNVITLLNHRLPQYAKIMGKTEIETLEIFVKAKNTNFTNWFQNANFPDLSEVYVFDTVADLKLKFPSGNYQCPCCEGISTDYQECNSARIVDKKSNKICDWKVYGFFGDLGKGIKVVIKEKFTDFPKPIAMLKPIELI